ncbi:MAG: hypothetical protein IKQ25_09605 [Lachnospiraceae bacterium]|nr:hypothetical protein [Lachnospiraceae bacterium]MBR6151524.1 hypothetical protein [Lachnospiraceae bacterium]
MSILKGRGKLGVLVLLMATLWLVMLTGCPRRHTEEEERQVLASGQSKLAQALEEHYGLKEGDFQIASSDIYWQSAYGYEAVKYSIEAGDKTFRAMVNLDSDEVFTDYYGKEFKEKLTAYLVEKMDGVSNLREAPIQILAVEFNQPSASEAGKGMIPASLSPEDFETYLEKWCEKEQLLNINLTLAWYSEDAEGLSDNLLELLTKGTDKIPSYVTVKRFACERKDELHPMDLKEIYSYYIGHNGTYQQYVTTYDYYEVSNNLVVRRTLRDNVELDSATYRFTARVDVKGHLSLYPEDEYYDLFFKGLPEETKVLYRKKDSKSKYYNVTLFKDSLFENWSYGHVKGDQTIVVGDLIQE